MTSVEDELAEQFKDIYIEQAYKKRKLNQNQVQEQRFSLIKMPDLVSARIFEELSWQQISDIITEPSLKELLLASDSKLLTSKQVNDKRTELLGNEGIVDNTINCMAWSHCSNYLVTGGFDSGIKIWDLFSLKLIRVMIHKFHRSLDPFEEDGVVLSVDWSIHDKILSTDGQKIIIWDIQTAKKLVIISLELNYYHNLIKLKWSPDGAKFLTNMGDCYQSDGTYKSKLNFFDTRFKWADHNTIYAESAIWDSESGKIKGKMLTDVSDRIRLKWLPRTAKYRVYYGGKNVTINISTHACNLIVSPDQTKIALIDCLPNNKKTIKVFFF